VRGRDEAGELTLATLFLRDEGVAAGEFNGSVVQPGGQKVTVRLKPAPETGGAVRGMQLEVSYAGRGLLRAAFRLAGRVGFAVGGAEKSNGYSPAWLGAGRYRRVTAGAAAALVIAGLTLVLWRLPSTPPTHEQNPSEQSVGPEGGGLVKEEEQIRVKPPVISATPSPTPKPARGTEEAKHLLARATWGTDRGAALNAVAVEPTRGEARMIDLSGGETRIVLSFPLYDEGGHPYSRYRLKLSVAGAQLWQQILRAPESSLTGYAHILNLSLFARRLPETGPYDLRVEGRTQGVWRPLGHLTLIPKNQ